MNLLASYIYVDLICIIQNEQEIHPLAELTDYYKLFFQAYYGQGHFVNSMENAMQYLDQELASMRGIYLPLVQDISNENGLYRVSLSVLSRKLLHKEEFIGHFCAVQSPEVDWVKWNHQWTIIESILKSSFALKDENSQSELCHKAIDNRQLISHSEKFRLTYNPHYRVMQLNWDDKLLHKLEPYI